MYEEDGHRVRWCSREIQNNKSKYRGIKEAGTQSIKSDKLSITSYLVDYN